MAESSASRSRRTTRTRRSAKAPTAAPSSRFNARAERPPTVATPCTDQTFLRWERGTPRDEQTLTRYALAWPLDARVKGEFDAKPARLAHDEMDLRSLARELRGEFHNNARPAGNAL